MLVGIVKYTINGKIVPIVWEAERLILEKIKMENEINELWNTINWRKMPHNHKDILHHDTCSLCVIEQALYGGKD